MISIIYYTSSFIFSFYNIVNGPKLRHPGPTTSHLSFFKISFRFAPDKGHMWTFIASLTPLKEGKLRHNLDS